MKEKLLALLAKAKEHKGEIIRIAAILVGAGIGVVVGGMINQSEEDSFLPTQEELTPEDIEEAEDEPEEELDET